MKDRIIRVERWNTDDEDFNSVHKECLLSSIQEARSVEHLKFIGGVLKLHKKLGIKAAKDPGFMAQCREAYTIRVKELKEQEKSNERLRQQPDRHPVEERPQDRRTARRLQRDLRSEW